MVKIVKQWLPAFLIMGAIFCFSSIPSQEMPNFGNWDTLFKKSGHLLGYAMLAAAYLRGIHSLGWRAVSIALVCVVLYSVTDEFHQSFIPGRTSTLIDVGIDTIGGAFGLSVVTLIPYIRKFIFQDITSPGKREYPK
jgi:VanZ family protein